MKPYCKLKWINCWCTGPYAWKIVPWQRSSTTGPRRAPSYAPPFNFPPTLPSIICWGTRRRASRRRLQTVNQFTSTPCSVGSPKLQAAVAPSATSTLGKIVPSLQKRINPLLPRNRNRSRRRWRLTRRVCLCSQLTKKMCPCVSNSDWLMTFDFDWLKTV